jgi:chemotaxis signal transduction protein
MIPHNAGVTGDGRFLIVRSEDLHCAVPAANVRRIARDLATHPLPGGQQHLIGLAHYGGEPLAVLDLRSLITGDSQAVQWGTTVIVRPRRKGVRARFGLAVDEALSVVSLEIEPSAGAPPCLVVGESVRDGLDVVVLDPEVLFDDGWDPEEAADG